MASRVASVAAAAALVGCGTALFAPLEHTVEVQPDLPTLLTDYVVEVADDSRAVFMGGCSSERQEGFSSCPALDATFEFFPAEGAFAQLPAAPNARYRHASAVRDGKMYVIGGLGANDSAVLPIDVFEFSSNTWSTLDAVLPFAVGDGFAFEKDGVIYFGGGYKTGENYTGNLDIFTLSADDELTSGGPALPVARGDARAVTLGENVYVVGGYDPANGFAALETMNVFDGVSWTEVEEPYSVRGDPAAAAYNGYLYVFGGQIDTGVAQDIQIFDPVTSKWHHGGLIPIAAHRMHAFVIQNKVFLAGGQERIDDIDFARQHMVAYVESSSIYTQSPISLHGSGTTNPEFIFYKVMGLFEDSARVPLSMSYRAVGSGTGTKEFIGDNTTMFLPASAFGSADIPLSKENFDAVVGRGFQVGQIPFMFGAIGLYVNIPEQRAAGEKVILTACDAANIYTGGYTKWSDLAKDGRNAFLAGVDKDIMTVHRLKGSSSTAGLFEFMKSGCPDVWEEEGNGADLADQWPCDVSSSCQSFVAEGSSGVMRYIESTEYSIGYLSVGHGFPESLQPVALENKNGNVVQEATPESIEAAGSSYTNWPNPFESFHEVSLVNTPGDTAWPIVLVSYIYVRKDQTARGTAAQLLKSFIEYILSSDGQAILGDYNFVGVSPEVLSISKRTLEELEMPFGSEPFIFETSTLAITGAGPNVLSTKRGSHMEFVEKSLKNEISALQTALNLAKMQILELHADIEHEHDHDHDHEDAEDIDSEPSTVAVIALILGVLNFILLLAALMYLCNIQKAVKSARQASIAKHHSNGDVELSQHDSEISESAAVRVA
mmetsp:Transcript_3006/g.5734  ORF Transcript_3006/g.5734 Transcript_3006/m.5734 type:complete len:831 (-) Transcript_3006:133-2625(-)